MIKEIKDAKELMEYLKMCVSQDTFEEDEEIRVSIPNKSPYHTECQLIDLVDPLGDMVVANHIKLVIEFEKIVREYRVEIANAHHTYFIVGIQHIQKISQ